MAKTVQSLTVGIIGGRGQLGSWCGALFHKRGAAILVADHGTELSNREVARRSDIVVVSVPIGVTAAVIDEVVDVLAPHQLIVDLTSVKTPFVSKMERGKSEVLSVHPMFAPNVSSNVGQGCIVCPIRAGDMARIFEQVLLEEGLHLATMTPEAHDKMMAVVQGLTHFQAIAAAHCMSELGFEPSETLQSASPVYRLRLAMIGRILAQNPRLYAEIQIFNPYVMKVLEELRHSHERLMSLIVARDVDGFVAEFERVRDSLGSFGAQALKEMSRLA